MRHHGREPRWDRRTQCRRGSSRAGWRRTRPPCLRSSSTWEPDEGLESLTVHTPLPGYTRMRAVKWIGNAFEVQNREHAAQGLLQSVPHNLRQKETLFSTQYSLRVGRRKWSGLGFDSASFSGIGTSAQLFIDEYKHVMGAVELSKFTTLGFGRGADPMRAFDKARKTLESQIDSVALDDITRRTLLGQLRNSGAIVRLVGHDATEFRDEVVDRISQRSGFRVVVAPWQPRIVP